MSDIRQAAQQALDFIVATNKSSQFWLVPESNLNKTVTALRAALAEPVAIHQWRNRFCSNWYDGHPDHEDGGGPYETRILYTAPEDAA